MYSVCTRNLISIKLLLYKDFFQVITFFLTFKIIFSIIILLNVKQFILNNLLNMHYFNKNLKNKPFLHYNHTLLTLSLHLNYTFLIYTLYGRYIDLI